MAKAWLPLDFAQRPLVELIDQVRRGELTPDEAAIRAQELGVGVPDRPCRTDFEAFKKEHWPLALAVAWIMSRDEDEAVRKWVSYKIYGRAVWRLNSWAKGWRELREVLDSNRITATGVSPKSEHRSEIPAVEWRDLTWEREGNVDFLSFEHGRSARRFHDTVVSHAAIVNHWKPATAAEKRTAQTVAAETACKDRLVEIMRANPTRPTPKAECQREFNLPRRAFDRAYRKAAGEAGATAWIAAGRRRKRIQAAKIETPK